MNEPRRSISIVVPLLNERDSLNALFEQIRVAASGLAVPWEVVFVDDGSTDRSDVVLEEIATRWPERVTVVGLRGNFGKSAALAAGFRYSTGQIVVTMDADLQDDPGEIPRFVEALEQGLDVVSGYKKRRHDPWHKVFPSRVFNWMVRRVTGVRLHDVNCGFKAYKREVLDEIRLYGELHRFVPVLASWRRFRVGEIVVEHRPRQHGQSKYGFGRFFRGLVDLLTVSFLTQYDRRPSHLFGKVGAVFSGLGFLICAYMSLLWLLDEGPIGDRPLLLLGVLLLVIGTQFFGSGLLAELMARNYAAAVDPYSVQKIIARRSDCQDSKEPDPQGRSDRPS